MMASFDGYKDLLAERDRERAYRRLLAEIDSELLVDNIKSLKFLCEPYLRTKQSPTSFYEILYALEKSMKIDQYHLQYFSELLHTIGRHDLATKINSDFNSSYTNFDRTDQFRVILFKVSEDLVTDEVARLRSLYENIPEGVNIEDGIDLFSLMLQNNDLSPENVRLLCNMNENIGRHDLFEKVRSFCGEKITDQYQMYKNKGEAYRMDSNPRGLCLIICNETFKRLRSRPGSKADIKNLEKMFTFLGFKNIISKDITAKAMKAMLKKCADSHALNSVSALAVAILSHGTNDDLIFGTDGSRKRGFIKKVDLQQIFTSRNCPAMAGKPKLFIIQACRGDMEQVVETNAEVEEEYFSDGVIIENRDYLSSQSAGRNVESDTAHMCFLHASSTGYKSHRASESGCPFIQVLTEAVIKHAHDTEFLDIFRKIQKHFGENLMKDKMSMPCIESTIYLKWYLNPLLRPSQQKN